MPGRHKPCPKRGHGEKSIGAVYSANTVGGIVAVLLAVFVT